MTIRVLRVFLGCGVLTCFGLQAGLLPCGKSTSSVSLWIEPACRCGDSTCTCMEVRRLGESGKFSGRFCRPDPRRGKGDSVSMGEENRLGGETLACRVRGDASDPRRGERAPECDGDLTAILQV